MAGDAFNLWDEPWVRVRHADGTVEEVSLLEAFRRAPEFTHLAGELPTQDAAILRLMLAVLYRTIEWGEAVTDVAEARSGWAAVWRAGQLPMPLIEAYADRWRDRFDLLDPEKPFMQVADLHTAKGSTSGLAKLIAEVPDGHQFFTVRAADAVTRTGLAEAARWLVHCQAFDPSGIKSGAVGDERVKGGKGYPIGTGWAARLGLLIVEGRTLFETLMLNLDARQASGPSAGANDDLPVWERVPLGAGEEGRPGATGPADLMTWPSRRVRLVVRDDMVIDALITNGDRIDLTDQHLREPMSSWGRPKEAGPTFPRGHQAGRSVWRGLEATLRADQSTRAKSSVPPMLVQEWLGILVNEGILTQGDPVRLRAVGVFFDTNYSMITGAVDDTLELPLAVLAASDLVREVHIAVGAAFEAVLPVGQLAANLARSAGGGPDDPRAPAREHAYAVLEPHFRRWLSSIEPGADRQELRASWQRRVHGVLVSMGREMATGAGPRAAEGSFVTDGTQGTPRLLDSGLAEKYYRAGLVKALPQIAADSAAAQTQSDTHHEAKVTV